MSESLEVLSTPFTGSTGTSDLPGGDLEGIEPALAEVLAGILHVKRASVDSNFFDDLGADSLVMAQFCARVRKRADLPAVSMKQVYQHPTIRQLAASLTEPAPSPVEALVAPRTEAVEPQGTPHFFLCGALQLLAYLVGAYLATLLAVRGYSWISAGSGPIEIYLRSVAFGAGSFVGLCILPILAKWLLVGRWKPQQIRIWSLAYFRFWFVKTVINMNPLARVAGSPLYVLYLRALGAKIGRGVVILSRAVPACTDLLTIGDHTVVRKDCSLSCYRAHAGLIQTGPVSIGSGVFVSEATVIDIDTSIGNGAQLGHRSSLHNGQAIPDGEHWHGSPAQRTEVDYRRVEPAPCGQLRRAVFTVVELLSMLLVTLPLAVGGVTIFLAAFPTVSAVFGSGAVDFTSLVFYRDVVVASLVVFFGSLIIGLLFMITVPRLLNLALEPEKVYPLYGFRYGAHRAVTRWTNSTFFTGLFGDSSYIVHYLQWVGYKLAPVQQTGSNFGTNVAHENPYLTSIGRGTMVADGLSIMNVDYSDTSFRVCRVSIGPRNFLGNSIAYPPGGRTGDNCLLATKVMVPIDGRVREGIGLLGSPSFEIPRSVERDATFDDLLTTGELGRHLAAKNRYNVRTMGLFLFVRWFSVFVVTLFAVIGGEYYGSYGTAAVAAASIAIVAFNLAYSILVERAVMGFGALSPKFCSIYDPYFWRHERLWKLLAHPKMFDGTPFKVPIWRLLGVRIGRRVFDDGCGIPERTLVTIGDGCTLNMGSEIQGHSQEDGAFKSDRITIGAGCTLGVGALVHYGATLGDGAVVAPDSFVMKGTQVAACTTWAGNPAREIRSPHLDTAARRPVLTGGPRL
ncbi:MAG TPA: Pls/PosA family non-ribosomal peptide synthetase [Propionibacteriaceae bacterium]|nr:Pls/PosA family non-ribosomal peptide synthetase [Propionibacteriaceae bacterium]